MSQDTTQKKPGMKRWIKVIFVLSLAMNLVIVGLVAGAAYRIKRFGPPPHVALEGPGSPVLRALGKEDRREVGRNIRKSYGKHSASSEFEIAHYQRLADLIAADPVDIEAVREASAGLDDRISQRRLVAREAWMQKLSVMSLEERKAYADRIRAILEDPKSWRKHPPKPRDH